MRLLNICRGLAERHPDLVGALAKVFEQAKALAMEKLSNTAAIRVTRPSSRNSWPAPAPCKERISGPTGWRRTGMCWTLSHAPTMPGPVGPPAVAGGVVPSTSLESCKP
jgi:hypothetical protein